MTQSTPTHSHTVNMNTLVLIEAAHWCAVRGRQFDQGCCFLKFSDSFSEWRTILVLHCKMMALAGYGLVSLHRNVCLTLVSRLFQFFFIILHKLYPLPFIFWFAWSKWDEWKKQFYLTGWCNDQFFAVSAGMDSGCSSRPGFLTSALLTFLAG